MNNNNIYDLQYFRNYARNDAAYKEEVEKYQRAIPSRAFIATLIKARKQLTIEEIIEIFSLTQAWQKEAIENRVNAMVRQQTLYQTARNQFALVDIDALIKGRIDGRAEGFGYLFPESGGEPLFVAPNDMAGLLHGDTVSASVAGIDHKGRRQAKIVEVLERKVTEFIGRIEFQGDVILVLPENRKIHQQFLVTKENAKGVKQHQIVRAKMLTPPTNHTLPTAEVISVLGNEITANIAVEQALLEHNIPHEFPDSVVNELKAITNEVAENDKKNRKDYRDLPLVTIDGITARDFDDAVYCAPLENKQFKLYVAIADVAHYVRETTSLNEEALTRGTSVYFPDRVIPMLPEKLSNGLCSLNPNVDRLCMVCELVINPAGEVKSFEFFEGVMRSHARLTYETVAEIIEGDEQLRDTYQEITPHLDHLYQLFKVLKKARDQRGSINFETRETVVEYDEQGNIEKIVPSTRNEAHMIIEECMIAANIAAATFLETAHLPTLYRVHPRPLEERLTKLRAFLREFNLGVRGGAMPTPKDYAECLELAHGNAAFDMIQTVMLRSLSQAVYQPANEGHFGLSLSHYAHFTSPIRRYPDLLVHRGIKYLIHKKQAQKEKPFSYDNAKMVQLGEHCSFVERRADEAVRDVTDWLKCQFMQQHVGKVLKGHVTGVTNFGLFVELDEMFVEGLIHISSLKDDFYHFDADHHRLIGERGGSQYRLNDPLTIKVVDANIETKRIDFELLSTNKKNTVSKKDLANLSAPKKSRKVRGKVSKKTESTPKSKRAKAKPTQVTAPKPQKRVRKRR